MGERQTGLRTRIRNMNIAHAQGDGNREAFVRKRLGTIGIHANVFAVQPNALVAIGSNRPIDLESSAVAATQSPDYGRFPSHRCSR